MFCAKCKKEIPDGIRFCPYCGFKQEVQPVQEKPVNAQVPTREQFVPVTESAAPKIEGFGETVKEEDDKTCSLMGETQYVPKKEPDTYQTQTQTPTQPPFAGGYYPNAPQNINAAPVKPAPMPEKPRKKKKSVIPVIIAVVLSILLIIAISVFAILFAVLDKNKETADADYITYLTENELYYAEKDNLQNPVKIADINYDEEAYYYVVENTVVRGDDIFYIQDVEYVSGNPVFSIYVKNMKKNGEPKKIDSDVTSGYFAVDSNGEKVVYTKDSAVYYNDLETAHRLASDVIGWCVDDNVENIMFLREDVDSMSLCKAEITEDASPQTLVMGITEIYSVSDDMTCAVYEKSGELYMFKDGGEKLIDSNVEDVYGEEYETFYYVVASDEGVSKATYFNDDLASSDSVMTEPNINDYQLYYYGFSYTSPEYYDAVEAYNHKLNRDKVREIAETPISSYDLYYFNGSAANLVCKDIEMYDIYYDDSRIVFKYYDAVKAQKFNMTDLSIVEDFEIYLLETRSETLTTGFASGSKIAREINFEQAAEFKFTDDAVYYLDNNTYVGESYTANGDLKKITVASDGTATSTLIEREVNYCSILDDEGKMGYFKEINNQSCGKFYVDGELIADKVFIHSVEYSDGKYYLLKNYNYNANKGELCVIENGETKVISETASGYNTRMEGVLFYSSDMKSDSDYNYTFNINRYDGTESVLMASDAVTWNVQPDYFLECDKGMMILLTGYRSYYYDE